VVSSRSQRWLIGRGSGANYRVVRACGRSETPSHHLCTEVSRNYVSRTRRFRWSRDPTGHRCPNHAWYRLRHKVRSNVFTLLLLSPRTNVGINKFYRAFFALLWFLAPAKRMPSKFVPRKRPDAPPPLKQLTLSTSASIQNEKQMPILVDSETSYIPFPGSEKLPTFAEPLCTPPPSPRDRRTSRIRKRTLSKTFVSWWHVWTGRGTRSRRSSLRKD
jgi:hypothetical protein